MEAWLSVCCCQATDAMSPSDRVLTSNDALKECQADDGGEELLGLGVSDSQLSELELTIKRQCAPWALANQSSVVLCLLFSLAPFPSYLISPTNGSTLSGTNAEKGPFSMF
jgi:hypothetical protein